MGSQGLDGIRTALDRLIAKVMNLVSFWELILDLVSWRVCSRGWWPQNCPVREDGWEGSISEAGRHIDTQGLGEAHAVWTIVVLLTMDAQLYQIW